MKIIYHLACCNKLIRYWINGAAEFRTTGVSSVCSKEEYYKKPAAVRVHSEARVTIQDTVSNVYEPELLTALQAIFDMAWQEIGSTPGYATTAEDIEGRRNDLAQMILLAHRSGLQREEIVAALLGSIPDNYPLRACRREIKS